MSDNVGYKAGEVAIGELLANIPGMQAALQRPRTGCTTSGADR